MLFSPSHRLAFVYGMAFVCKYHTFLFFPYKMNLSENIFGHIIYCMIAAMRKGVGGYMNGVEGVE
jgi:hypothetical protein